MTARIAIVFLCAVLLPWCRAEGHADAANGCAGFSWNVQRELALMREPAIRVIADANGGSSAVLVPGRHYAVTLAAQDAVKFPLAPARPARDAAARAAVLQFSVPVAGKYRVSISSRHWIDVVGQGKAIESADHQGSRDCELVHKIVEFELPANTPLTLQLSGSADQEIGLAISPSPGGSPSAG